MLCTEVGHTHPDPGCPNADQHTPHPEGYLQHAHWAESMVKTHTQKRCRGCGLWNIWTPIPAEPGEG